MIKLSADLVSIASTSSILPFSEELAPSPVNISLSPLGDDPVSRAVAHLESGDMQGAWEMARPFIEPDGGSSALIGGALAAGAGEVNAAISALEMLLSNETIADPSAAGRVLLAFTDGGMLCFDINSLAGVALLAVSYAKAKRYQDAIDLTAQAYTVSGAETMLALHLVLLRDLERWDELVEASSSGNPSITGALRSRCSGPKHSRS